MNEKSYLLNEDAFATLLYRICVNRYGEQLLEWESDTILLAIHKDFGADVPEVNLDKILSIVALKNSLNGQLCFFNEVNCFKNTVQAFNHIPPNYQFMGASLPEHIHWTLHEIALLFPEYKLHEEPAKYLGLCYHKIGAMVVPEDIKEYQELLDYYNKNIAIVPKVKEYIKTEIDVDPDTLPDDDFMNVQLLIAKADVMYMANKKEEYAKDQMALELK